jgi:hypothetical protein
VALSGSGNGGLSVGSMKTQLHRLSSLY